MNPELEALEVDFELLLSKLSVLHWQQNMAEESLEKTKVELELVERELREVSEKIDKLRETPNE